MFGNERKEFGDYQTPVEFCYKVCNYIKKQGLANTTDVILEPTCGIGNFLFAANETFVHDKVVGIEINREYADCSKERLPSASIEVENIFDVDTRKLCGTDDVLVIGNPPWAMSSSLSYNLPQKANFKGLRGIDAITGSSNFDICEYIILKLLHEYEKTNSLICMLCKTSVARNVILEMDRSHIGYQKVEMLNFNSSKVFGVSAAACVLIIKLSSKNEKNVPITCEVKNFDDETVVDRLAVNGGMFKSTKTKIDLRGKCQFVWRQGVKHDCSKVMELSIKDENIVNKEGQPVHIERDLVYPLVKSSQFKKPVINEFSKFVIVTQKKSKQDTSYIQTKFPLTWEYLSSNIEKFRNRKSTIYKNAAPFAMFGVGEYSFAPYKVGLSGFYKKPLFSLLYSDKPVMTDDTSYFLAFDRYDIAYCAMLLLNSSIVQDFLQSIAFLDSKRPYTVRLLSQLDFKKCIEEVPYDLMKQVEKELALPEYITAEMYDGFVRFIRGKVD